MLLEKTKDDFLGLFEQKLELFKSSFDGFLHLEFVQVNLPDLFALGGIRSVLRIPKPFNMTTSAMKNAAVFKS